MTDTSKEQAKIDAFIVDLAKDLKPLVARIDADPLKTTRNNYGRYLALFSQLSHGDARMGKLVCAALIVAGANRQGVADAYRISFGDHPYAYGKEG